MTEFDAERGGGPRRGTLQHPPCPVPMSCSRPRWLPRAARMAEINFVVRDVRGAQFVPPRGVLAEEPLRLGSAVRPDRPGTRPVGFEPRRFPLGLRPVVDEREESAQRPCCRGSGTWHSPHLRRRRAGLGEHPDVLRPARLALPGTWGELSPAVSSAPQPGQACASECRRSGREKRLPPVRSSAPDTRAIACLHIAYISIFNVVIGDGSPRGR